MPTQPRPVYLVEPPPPPAPWWKTAGGLIAAAVLLVVAVAVGTAFLPAAGIPDPFASFRATDAPARTTRAPSPTVDLVAVQAAADDGVNRLQAVVNDKGVACSTLSGAAYTKCQGEYDALSAKLDRLFTCMGSAQTFPAVAACDKAAGLKP